VFCLRSGLPARYDKIDGVPEKLRDEHLLTSEPGTSFIAAYFQGVPPVDWIAQHPVMRKPVGMGPYPVSGLSKRIVGEDPSGWQ